MAIAYRSEAHNDVDDVSITVSKPSGTIDGDVMLAVVYAGNETISGAPGGWTLIGSLDWFGGKESSGYYKVASSEGANYTWTIGASSQMKGTIVTYSGASGVNTTGTDYNTCDGAGAYTPPTITPSVDNCMIVALQVGEVATTDVVPDSSPAATQRVEWRGTTPEVVTFVQDYQQTTAAAVSLGVTGWAASDLIATYTVALAEAASTGAATFLLLGVNSP